MEVEAKVSQQEIVSTEVNRPTEETAGVFTFETEEEEKYAKLPDFDASAYKAQLN